MQIAEVVVHLPLNLSANLLVALILLTARNQSCVRRKTDVRQPVELLILLLCLRVWYLDASQHGRNSSILEVSRLVTSYPAPFQDRPCEGSL